MIKDVLLVIERCIRGEESAWTNFVKEFGSMAENILRKSSGVTPHDRENIIQNVFFKLFKGGLRNFKGATKYEFFKYFKAIVIHERISYLKSEGRYRKEVPLNEEGQINEEGAEGSSLNNLTLIQDDQSRPDLVAERKEVLKIIQKVMEGFPLLDQQVFWMKLQGYKDEEIKKVLSIPLGTVASKYSRIKTKIVEALGES